MRPRLNPEELIDRSAEPPLALDLTCNRCGLAQSDRFDWACVSPGLDPEDAGWDGVFLSRAVTCAGCGAVDDYALAPDGLVGLRRRAHEAPAGGRTRGRVVQGVSQLWDGSQARRPSAALATLRRLAAEQPRCAEAHRRLGNGLERFGELADAAAEWQKALALDPAEIEAAYSLAAYWLGPGNRPADGSEALRRAFAGLPEALKSRPELRPWCKALVDFLRDVAASTPVPLVLGAAWTEGSVGRTAAVTVSSVDVRKVRDGDRLAEFLARPNLLALELNSHLPENEPTILQRLLDGEPDPFPGPVELPTLPIPRRAAAAVPRNAPCPCGSGNKFKRCCGG